MLQGKYRCELLKNRLFVFFTIDLEAGPTSHAWMFNSYDSARPKGPHVDGPIKSELRSLCYKDGKLLIGTKCSSVYEADCQPPRVKVRKLLKCCRRRSWTISINALPKNLRMHLLMTITQIMDVYLIFLRNCKNLKCGGIWTTIISASAVRFQVCSQWRSDCTTSKGRKIGDGRKRFF